MPTNARCSEEMNVTESQESVDNMREMERRLGKMNPGVLVEKKWGDGEVIGCYRRLNR